MELSDEYKELFTLPSDANIHKQLLPLPDAIVSMLQFRTTQTKTTTKTRADCYRKVRKQFLILIQ